MEEINKELNEIKKNQTQEKEKLIQKIKEYKETSESNMQQIKILKKQIKEKEGNNTNNELYNKIKELENNIFYKNEQIEGLKIVLNKLTKEREELIMNQKNNNAKISNNDLNGLKEAKTLIKELTEKIKKLEEENNDIMKSKEKEENKLMDSEYKSEGGEEEYTIKKMIKATKKRNQSEDIKIDYPGLSNMKQKYEELEEKYRKLEECLYDLLTKLKCTEEIKPVIIDICKILQIGDDMIKQIINE